MLSPALSCSLLHKRSPTYRTQTRRPRQTTAAMKTGSVVLVATVILVAAPALALEDGRSKPPASLLPPAPFESSTQKPSPINTTTTPVPTTHHNTTANTTTPQTTTHTTANTTTTQTTTHTTANTTTPQTTTHTTANTTTTQTTTHTTANTTTTQTTTHTTANTTTTQTTTHTTPKPEPTPKTNLTTGNYTVKIGGKLCVMVQAAIQVNVNNSHAEGTYIVQPATVSTDGQCDRATASLNINFQHGFINMKFLKNDTTNMVYVTFLKVSLSYAFKTGVQTSFTQVNDSMQLFPAELSHSYSCTSDPVDMGSGVSLEFSHDRMQAFNFTNNQFGLPDLCKADKPDYTVAIAVGVVLIILIIIVVLAYLISRRKRSDGYQSL